MTFELLEQVITRREISQITVEQAIDKILLWLHEFNNQLVKPEAKPK
jgi:hypothetical protein